MSAFEAYSKDKNARKKAGKVKKTLSLDESKPDNVTATSSNLNSQEDLLWENFITEMESSKKMKLSTPLSPSAEFKFPVVPDLKKNNVFLSQLKGEKKLKKLKANGIDKNIKRIENNVDIIKVKKKKLKNVEIPISSDKETNSSFTSVNFEATLIPSEPFKEMPKKKRMGKAPIDSDDDWDKFKLKNSLPKANLEVSKPELKKSPISLEDSIQKGKEMLGWILSPVNVDDFFKNYWEKKPLHIARGDPHFFDGIMSLDDLDLALRLCPMYFSKNIDVTSYINGERSTEDLQGRARPGAVWNFYKSGHSIRVLNPQTFIPNVGKLVSTLQEYFRCMVGVNSYLTPAGTQGFAPHYDDIEAFVLQLEGEKLWKVYPPRNETEVLPRFSSSNFSQDEIGKYVLKVRLQPGDLLYFPRGWIHQARSVENHHSLHITLSTYQRNTWGDLLEKTVPVALELAKEGDIEMRQGLPIDYLNHLGLVHSDSNSHQRELFLKQATHLFSKLLDRCLWDAAVDQLGKQFIHDSFPTPTNDDDIGQANSKMTDTHTPFTLDTRLRLTTANCLRLVSEEDAIRVYYNTDNSKEYHGEEIQGFDISEYGAPALEVLIKRYPKFLKVKKLNQHPEGSFDDVTELLNELRSRSLIVTK